MNIRFFSKCLLLSVGLAWFVVMLGAYTRLTDAGLGCPDWPGCYGHWVLPRADTGLAHAQASFPGIPIQQRKAWTEMLHRYVAGGLGSIILLLAVCQWRYRGLRQALGVVPYLLVALVLMQATLGMWTVTWRLLPLVVTLHLLGGISILSGLWWCYLALARTPMQTVTPVTKAPTPLHGWVWAALCVLCVQIALGGWVSTNYAGVSCVGFPRCNGQWLPQLHWGEAFRLLSPVGENYEGGRLDSDARVTIQMVHRLWAVVVVVVMAGLMRQLWRSDANRQRRMALAILAVLCLQLGLGVLNVLYLLPLPVAVAHNGVAALLLLILLLTLQRTRELRHVAVAQG